MSDLDTIAINDMKHELCDSSPCYDCRRRLYIEPVISYFEKELGNVDHIQLYSNLNWLTLDQQQAFKAAVDAGVRVVDLAHDLSGIARMEACFVPRIQAIATATPFIG